MDDFPIDYIYNHLHGISQLATFGDTGGFIRFMICQRVARGPWSSGSSEADECRFARHEMMMGGSQQWAHRGSTLLGDPWFFDDFSWRFSWEII